MTSITDLQFKQLLNQPRGDDVTRINSTTIHSASYSVLNSITPSTDKVVYVYGVNWIPRAKTTKLELFIDGTTTGDYTVKKELLDGMETPAPGLQPVVLFNPPLRAATGVYLKGKASADQGNFKSIICAFEAES